MALFVIPVPNPAAGHDWVYTVPGQYLEHITAIGATCNPAGTAPTVAIDSSGSGENLTYDNPNVAFGIAGYVSVDTMVRQTGGLNHFVATGPFDTTFATGNDLMFACWTDADITVGSGPGMVRFTGSTTSSITWELLPDGAGGLQQQLHWVNIGGAFGGAVSPPGITRGPHFYGARYDRTLDKVQYYVDGAPYGGLVANSGSPPAIDTSSTCLIGGDPSTVSHPHYDEVMFGGNPSTDGDFANLYSLRADFDLYTRAVLAMGPDGYYHLDELSSGPQRQVTLDITDGTRTVLEVPTGFAESPNPGTFAYSWQPNLNSSTQTPDRITTAIAVPDLILPAGYTIGTRTLDLDPGDQWSDIFIWWDDSVMQANPELNPIDYPPGAYLVIVPQGA